ncbi:MAG: TonB-dependent receptor, partial [Bacteroidota bacterium]
ILENIRSIVGEWNSIIGGSMANNLIAGYTYNDESRGSIDKLFPLVEIMASKTDQTNYTSFGAEPFTPNNELRYSSYQFQDNFTWYAAPNHTLTFGASVEKYKSENVFFPGSQSVYVYNSLADFYQDANAYLANPNRTVADSTLRRFQVRYNNIPGQTKPIQPLEVLYAGAYAQDEWQVTKDFRLTAGIRFDIPSFGNTGFDNVQADTMSFLDENGVSVKYNSGKLPDAHIQISPRVGFNWDVMGDRTTQLRGGTGLFSGPPLYVWISNQIGNTGVLTGFLSVDNTKAYPFNPNPEKYKPTNVTGNPAPSYELALTDPDFKFPQVWRTNIAVDQKLPFDFVGTLEYLYNKDVNGIYYIDASLRPANSAFTGADARPRWNYASSAARRINGTIVQDAVVLKNQSVGKSWNFAASLEKQFSDGFFAKAGYSYGEAQNTVDPGSIAFGSWSDNKQYLGANNPGLGFSSSTPGSRLFLSLSYRAEYFDFGATTVSVFWEGRNNLWNTFNSAYSYTFSGDMNGDGISGNDLIYIPKDQTEMNFQQYTQTVAGVARTFTVAEQAAAWDAFINQDSYLSKHRGEYAVRNAAVAPIVYRADLSIIQEVFAEFLGKRNSLQIRADFLNVGNLINKNWGVGQRPVNFATTTAPTAQPLSAQGADASGKALYRLRTNPGTNDLMTNTFEYSNLLADVFQIQLGIRYAFN